MKAKRYFAKIYTSKGTIGSNELSITIFAKNKNIAKKAVKSILDEQRNNYDEIYLVSLTCLNNKIESYSHIHTVDGEQYGF